MTLRTAERSSLIGPKFVSAFGKKQEMLSNDQGHGFYSIGARARPHLFFETKACNRLQNITSRSMLLFPVYKTAVLVLFRKSEYHLINKTNSTWILDWKAVPEFPQLFICLRLPPSSLFATSSSLLCSSILALCGSPVIFRSNLRWFTVVLITKRKLISKTLSSVFYQN